VTRPGDRIVLVGATDPHSRLQPGTLGTVDHVDSLGTVHVLWDNGSRLGLGVVGLGRPLHPRGEDTEPTDLTVCDQGQPSGVLAFCDTNDEQVQS